jgi:hypothetical protein
MAKLTESFVRDILTRGINVSEIVELLNEEYERKDEVIPSVFIRHECIFKYCPHPELCKDECKNPVPFGMGNVK